MTQYIKKLPAVFQTVTEKKFFDATFDQVFSKKDSSLLAGYMGRRYPGVYNPITDFYVPEPTKNRTWWQLEATAFARTEDTTKSNIYFYEDLLNRIEYYGGNTLNQDRLFESEYYSFGPPIDYDMFINYHNYYWVEQGLTAINISGVLASDIIGKPSYVTPSTAVPPNLTLTTGLSIVLLDDPVYNIQSVVENMGGCDGIQLIAPSPDFTAGAVFEFLPWDGTIELSNGRIINDTKWDGLTWDTQTQPQSGDYITIERGASDRNSWSRTNKWFHIDAITTTVSITGTAFPANATRALRPIIQFTANLELYKSGTQFRSDIDFGFRDSADSTPILRAQLQGQQISTINDDLNINIIPGDLVCFFNDLSTFDFWDAFDWDVVPDGWDTGFGTVNKFIFKAVLLDDGTVDFTPHTSWYTPIVEGDIVLVGEDGPYNSAQRGQTWYYSDGIWQEAYNDKVFTNQPPLFQLYDHDGVRLDDPTKYPLSTFLGNKVFSYKINTEPGAYVDPVLKFPILYTSLGQASDIVFQNNLITDRYTYTNNHLPEDGYYYYKFTSSTVLYNSWNLYSPCPCSDIEPEGRFNCLATSKQRVIDRYTVGFGTLYQFKLSVTPYGFVPIVPPISPDVIVSVNGKEVKHSSIQSNGYTFEVINNDIYVVLTQYITDLMLVPQTIAPVVEIQTYTQDLLNPDSPGYFQIPQQLEANPNQLEVSEISGSDLTEHFSSIISNQIGASGIAFGGTNNYRDTRKNRSLGLFILQNVNPLLKTMLISSSEDLDFITGVRFSQDEYTKFKNKYLRTALQLINQEFNPVSYYNNTVIISAWVDEILKTVNISKEFSNSFAYSYMIANGLPFSSESYTVPITGDLPLTAYVDLSDPKNSLYIYDVTGQERLLVIGEDYEIISTNFAIDIQFNLTNVPVGNNVVVSLYKSPLPAYIPSTPTKVGAYPTYLPRIELDVSYAIPTNVIIGHDGSKTIAYGDYRDQLLLELEKRIYNLIQYKFRNQYYLPIRLESIKSGFFRQTRYTRGEYLDITESYLNKWSAKNRANYRVNDWATSMLVTPDSEKWKLYNYRVAKDTTGTSLNLPGNWKGIFQYYYDTYYPNTRPWEMLGFSDQPSWWVSEYGSGVTTLAGQTAWPNSPSYFHLWLDLEAGIIRQGPTAIYDPETLLPQAQKMWARPGLSTVIPVDALGEIRSVVDIFNVAVSGNIDEPFDGFDLDWIYGDGSPVEQAWMSTSSYAFNIQEFLYLMKPASYGEYFWDTVGTELSPCMIDVPGIDSPVMSNTNWQFVQNDTYTNSDPFFAWMRPKNKDQIVHAETIDSIVQVKFGYQRWISDYILFLGKDITSTFGQKIRTLDVNLANKFAGFTNKDTSTVYIESVSSGATTNTLLIPTNNFDVVLHKSPVVDTYSYSGVIIRGLADGTFAVYGYDLLNSEFTILNRSNERLVDITIGGTPSEFKYFTPGETYFAGDIVRYNGVYYRSLVTQKVEKFIISGWQKLNGLPVQGGISVSYKPISLTTTTKLPYGSILKSAQDVFDFLIGWGAFLEMQGWKFDDVNSDTNEISNWLYSAKQFLFWLNSSWAPDASIQLSPSANKATLVVSRGYPDDVETMSNGLYSISDKYGIAIAPNNTATDRGGRMISVEPTSVASGGIYFLQINASETEHVFIFDNITSFNDVIYLPLLRARQQRIRLNGFRSNGWYGKMEAPGYLILDNQLVPNFDSIVDSMRYFYDPNITIDNPSLEDLGRHLIGYESKSYLDNMQVTNDIQYLFYQGVIRQKGTTQSFEKLFRSNKVQADEIIEVFEEWALKLGEFGNTIEQVSTEFILKPEQNVGEVIVAQLNYVPSTIGFVKQIDILNAENTYVTVPVISIAAPDADPTDPALTAPLRQAKAYAVLDSLGRISRIDISDPGYGYLASPTVTIVTTESNDLDILYSTWQGQIIRDVTLDNIVNVDIDQTDKWTVRPPEPQYSLQFPTTPRVEYSIPNAGYVNFNDIDWHSFDVAQSTAAWGTQLFNPSENDTLWIAKTFTDDWNVFKLIDVDFPMSLGAPTWRIQEGDQGTMLLLTDIGTSIVPQDWPMIDGSRQTDFGSMIVIQKSISGKPVVGSNYTFSFIPYIGSDYNDPGVYVDPTTTIQYNAYVLTYLNGDTVGPDALGNYEELNNLLLYKTMRWYDTTAEPVLPIYVGLGDYIWVDNVNDKWAVFQIQGTPGYWDIGLWDPEVIEHWSPNYGWEIAGPLYFNPHRVQETLINTSMFESASVFESRNKNELVQLPVYDPFKGILPGLAKQNISFMSQQDPARYNITNDPSLFTDNIIFGESQVGELWWDLSTARYVYYEQPKAIDDTETENDNLVYRRDHWGQLFPGSSASIYEWVKSPVPPSEYTGPGTLRSTVSYVKLTTSNKFTNITEVNYYFWVMNTTNKPNIENRTMAALDVAQLLESPKSRGFVFFSPIKQTDNSNSYMFYNVQEILAYRGDNVQIEYRLSEREDQKHTQWSFFRDGDKASTVTDQFWNKMVDSLCGYTKMFPVTDNYTNSIILQKDLPWDVYQWDISAWDSATTTSNYLYGEILPVPDPTLSLGEKYGIEYRPRQSMFVDIHAARKIFVQSANDLLKHIPIRDDNPSWDISVETNDYWKYINWYEIGYENVVPTIVFNTLAEASAALAADQLNTTDIIQVKNGTVDGRFVLYAVVQLNPSIATYSLEKVCIEKSAIELLVTVYTVSNLYQFSVELRELLDAFRTEVMIGANIVDQNKLFFSMMNYVLSEQRNPDWLFKSSYIYIKENNQPLNQVQLYIPDQINNIINYINDIKPYHTKIRDYTSTYQISDLALGTATEVYDMNIKIKFGPDFLEAGNGEWDVQCNSSTDSTTWVALPWDSYSWDVCLSNGTLFDAELFTSAVEQFISREDVYTVNLTFYDISKKGRSELFPYTFSFDDINLNNPQTFITPHNIVGVQMGSEVLSYGVDYFVGYNTDTTYTVYFYNSPTTVPVALVWMDGGGMQHFRYETYRNEIAYGFPLDNFVVNVDTLLPVNDISGVLITDHSGVPIIPAPVVAPYVGWGDVWDQADEPVVSQILIDSGGMVEVPWDTPLVPLILPNSISYKENTSMTEGLHFYRNSNELSGTLVNDIPAPTATNENLDVITIFVDPVTHPSGTNILPDPGVGPGVIWVDGERIEYRTKTHVTYNTWELGFIRRGTQGTIPAMHSAMVPSSENLTILVPNIVFVEKDNIIPDTSDINVWNALDTTPDWTTGPGIDNSYTSIQGVPAGGLWYAQTAESQFLKNKEGKAIL